MATRATARHKRAPPRRYERRHLGPAIVNGRRCSIRPGEDGFPEAHYIGTDQTAPPPEWDAHYKDHRGVHHWILFLTMGAFTLVPLACLVAAMLA